MLSGATTSYRSGPGNDSNEGVVRIAQSSSMSGASRSDCFVSYPQRSLRECYPSAEMQSVYFPVPSDWANIPGEWNQTWPIKWKFLPGSGTAVDTAV